MNMIMTILYHCNNIMYTFFVYTVMNELKQFFFLLYWQHSFPQSKRKTLKKKKKRKESKHWKGGVVLQV